MTTTKMIIVMMVMMSMMAMMMMLIVLTRIIDAGHCGGGTDVFHVTSNKMKVIMLVIMTALLRL